jgi:hypothetical protein
MSLLWNSIGIVRPHSGAEFHRAKWHIKVMSYDVVREKSTKNIQVIATQVLKNDPDIVCFTEMVPRFEDKRSPHPLRILREILAPKYTTSIQGLNRGYSNTILYVRKDHDLELHERKQVQPGKKSKGTILLACGKVRGQPVVCSTAHLDNGSAFHTNDKTTQELRAIHQDMDEVGADWAQKHSTPETEIRKLYVGDTDFARGTEDQQQIENTMLRDAGFVDLRTRLNFLTDKTLPNKEKTAREHTLLTLQENYHEHRVLVAASFAAALDTDGTSITIMRQDLSTRDGLLCTLAF